QMGMHRHALTALGRAVQLDPKNTLARDALWGVHRDMDFDQVVHDPETLALVNFDLCLERAGWLLLLDHPKPEQIREAQRLLDLVESQKPALQPKCAYWRSVAFTHQRQYDRAAAELEGLLDSERAPDTPQRRSVLFPAWQLALTLSSE